MANWRGRGFLRRFHSLLAFRRRTALRRLQAAPSPSPATQPAKTRRPPLVPSYRSTSLSAPMRDRTTQAPPVRFLALHFWPEQTLARTTPLPAEQSRRRTSWLGTTPDRTRRQRLVRRHRLTCWLVPMFARTRPAPVRLLHRLTLLPALELARTTPAQPARLEQPALWLGQMSPSSMSPLLARCLSSTSWRAQGPLSATHRPPGWLCCRSCFLGRMRRLGTRPVRPRFRLSTFWPARRRGKTRPRPLRQLFKPNSCSGRALAKTTRRPQAALPRPRPLPVNRWPRRLRPPLGQSRSSMFWSLTLLQSITSLQAARSFSSICWRQPPRSSLS